MKKALPKHLMCFVFAALLVLTTILTTMTGQFEMKVQAEGTQMSVVSTGTTEWQYRDDNAVPADGWKTSEAVTENEWKSGTGSFGAKNGEIGDLGGGYTPVNLLTQYIEGTSDDIPVFYFRTTFSVAEPDKVTQITGNVVYDDAAVIYINGQKIAGFDDGSFDEQGYGGSNASTPKTGTIQYSDIEKLALKETGNVLAVELHNGRSSSSDIYFDFQSLVLDTTEQAEQTAEIKGLSLEIGADETQRNAAWLSSSSEESYIQVAEKPADYQEGDDFPTDSAQSYAAGQASSQVSGFNSNKATIINLKENTSYIYRVGNDEGWSNTYEFTTQSFGDGDEFSFLFAGDPQIGASGNAGSDTENWQNTMRRSLNTFPETSFLISAGDQVNSNNDDAQYDGFLSPEVIRSIPLAVNVGNHDNGNERYTDYYNMPNLSSLGTSGNTGSGSGDYWFMYNGTLFMSLNSNNVNTSEHKAFLEDALDKNPNALWTVVTFHHSTYSVANHYTDSDVIQRRAELSPVFSELGIDVVLMGHDHYYTRTYMMEGSNPVIPEGNNVQLGEEAPSIVTNPEEGQVFYLTANSASGSKYYSKNGSLGTGWPEYVAVQDQSNRTSITNVTVTDKEFRMDTYYTDSDDQLELMDSFTIRRTEAPEITVPSSESGMTEITKGQAFNPMTGVSAADCDGNDLTDRIFVTVYAQNGDNETQVQYVDTSKTGAYRIVYEVTDNYGKTVTAEQLVKVVDLGGTTDPDNPGGTTDPDNPGGTTDPDNPGGTTDPDNPGGMTDPDNPGSATDPDTPDNVTGSGNLNADQSSDSGASGAQNTGSAVQTGDESLPVILYIGIMAAAAAACLTMAVLRLKGRK